MSDIENQDALLAEYSAANDSYMHYDDFSWQVGSILMAGVFVFWGFLSNENINENIIVVCSILIVALMSTWMLYSAHNRQIYLFKLHRLHEIENIFGLKQHLRWIRLNGKESEYSTEGPSGHTLNAIIYIVTSLGAPLIAYIKNIRSYYLILTVAIVLFVLLWANINEKKVVKKIKQLGITSG